MCDLASCATSWNSARRRSRGSAIGFELAEHGFLLDLLPALQRGQQQRVARREMPVEAALGDAEPARQRFDRDRGHALLGDQVQGGLRPVVGAEAARCVLLRFGGSRRHRGSLPYASVRNSMYGRTRGGRRASVDSAVGTAIHTCAYGAVMHAIVVTVSHRLSSWHAAAPRRSRRMSIAIPFLAFLLAGAFAAYHRLRLAGLGRADRDRCWSPAGCSAPTPPRRSSPRVAGRADRGAAAAAADPQAAASPRRC